MTEYAVSPADGDAVRAMMRHSHALREPDPIHDDNGDEVARLFVVPEGYRLHTVDLSPYRDRPKRKSGETTVKDADSFIDFVSTHGEPGTTLYADETAGTIKAVLNASTAEAPGWADHSCTLRLSHTTEWVRWANADSTWLSQEAFAEFVEESLPDFRDPTPAHMLELSRTFEATKQAEFEGGIRLDNGQRQIGYKETVAARAGRNGHLEVPETMTVGLRVYKGGPGFNVEVRLRYRINNGNLVLAVKIDRREDLIETAFAGTVETVTDRLRGSVDDLLIIHGTTR